MKTIKLISLFLILSLSFISCNKEEQVQPTIPSSIQIGLRDNNDTYHWYTIVKFSLNIKENTIEYKTIEGETSLSFTIKDSICTSFNINGEEVILNSFYFKESSSHKNIYILEFVAFSKQGKFYTISPAIIVK